MKDGHDLLALRLVTSIHSSEIVAFHFFMLLDSHAIYFSILESTFQLDLEEGIQIMVNPPSKRLVPMNPFNF